MTFEQPLVLLGLLLLPLAALAYAVRERRQAAGRAAFAAPPVMPSVVPRGAGWRRHLPIAVYGLALALLVVAASRPQATLAVGVEQASVVVVTDRSGSMLAEDVLPNRLEAARAAAKRFLRAVPDEVRVGAIAFNQDVRILHSPTREHGIVRDAIDSLEAAGSTATGDALSAALRMVEAARGAAESGEKPPPAAIVLLSDGESVRGSDPIDAAREARDAGVPVFTVALGTPDGTIERRRRSGEVVTVPVPPDRRTLRRIAEISGGEAFATADAGRLERVFARLGSEVADEPRRQEVASFFAGGALLLLVAGALASLRWFGRFV